MRTCRPARRFSASKRSLVRALKPSRPKRATMSLKYEALGVCSSSSARHSSISKTSWPRRRSPSTYWRIAQLAPPWNGSPATIPATKGQRTAMRPARQSTRNNGVKAAAPSRSPVPPPKAGSQPGRLVDEGLDLGVERLAFVDQGALHGPDLGGLPLVQVGPFGPQRQAVPSRGRRRQ